MQSNGFDHPNLAALLGRLDGVKPSGKGWVARCPSHEDSTPSLTIALGDKGGIVLQCKAGTCKTADVLAAVGMTFADVGPTRQTCNGKPSNGKPRIVATYDYRDERGELLYQVVRSEPKTFRLRRPDASKPGCWLYSLGDVRRVLYRLPELLAADPAEVVYIVEGEKDADRLRSWGLVATCNAGGAGKWRTDYCDALQSRSVVLLPDNDEPGRKHADAVARMLDGVAASVRIVELPELPKKGDVSDWLDAGGTIEQLAEFVEAAPEWTPAAMFERSASVVRLSDVTPEVIRWLWPGRIPLGKLTLIVGDPGTGKSTMTVDLAARVSAGKPWPDSPNDDNAAGDVLLLGTEDGLADTIRPRLDAAGGNPTRVSALNEVYSLDVHLPKLELAIRQCDNPRLLVIDPISAFLGNIDSHKNADVRRVLEPLAQLADRYRVAIVLVHHMNKSAGISALYRASGSLAFTAAVRMQWLVGADPNDAGRRLVLPVKSNVVKVSTGLAYRIQSDDARAVGWLEWEAKPVEISADEVLGVTSHEETERRDALDDATAWLSELLDDGPVFVDELQKLAKANGHSQSTLRRAKKRLGAEARKQGNGRGAKWFWTMPAADGQLRLFDKPSDEPTADD
ncbi:MAG: AAA family ATPase [Planctomycetota bacterium]|nr:AAA family ATPase [Planctomycetota bacterium]